MINIFILIHNMNHIFVSRMPRVFYLHTEPLCQGRSTRGLRDICAELFVGKKPKEGP